MSAANNGACERSATEGTTLLPRVWCGCMWCGERCCQQMISNWHKFGEFKFRRSSTPAAWRHTTTHYYSHVICTGSLRRTSLSSLVSADSRIIGDHRSCASYLYRYLDDRPLFVRMTKTAIGEKWTGDSCRLFAVGEPNLFENCIARPRARPPDRLDRVRPVCKTPRVGKSITARGKPFLIYGT